MKSARTIHRAFKFALQNFWRNIWLSIATILVFVLTLTMINVLMVVHVLTQTAVQQVEDRIDVSVYFKRGTSESTILGAREYLMSLSQVRHAEFISAEDAYARFTERHRGDASIIGALETIESNPFGGSLVIQARNPEDFDFILEALNNPQFGDAIEKKDFEDHERIIARIQAVTQRVQWFALGIGAVFLLIAALIVFNAIRIAIYTHREEIGIMKLVGASNGFIRLPFILEALLFSVISTLIMAAILLPTLQVIEPQISAFFGATSIGLSAFFISHWLVVFGGPLLVLAFLSVVSASIAMSRYLNV